MGYNSVADNTGPSSFRFAVVGTQICEIPQNSERIWTYNSSRSSKVINLVVNWNRICDFLLKLHWMKLILQKLEGYFMVKIS